MQCTSPSKMESKMPYTIICLNLHVQVGSLSPVFVPRDEAIQQPQAQVGFPFEKKSVRHL